MQKKIDYIVVLRVLCTICVVLNHVPLVASHVFANQISKMDSLATNAIVHLVHFAVPVFVMITGALLLDSSRQVSFEKALKKYAWRMCAVLLTVGWLFAIMEYYLTTKEISFFLFSNSLLNVLTGNTWTHMWYLYMLIGLYLFIPFLKIIVDNAPKSIVPLIVVLFVFSSLTPMLKHFFGLQFGVTFPIGSCYVLYLLLGCFLVKHRIDMKLMSIIAFVMLSLFLLFCSYMETTKGCESLKFFEAYESPVEVIAACALFLIVMHQRCGGISRLYLVQLLDKNSFGVYVFHMLWINILYKVVKFNPFEYGLLMLIPVLLGVVALSVATTVAFRKIPFIGKYI